MLQRIQTLYFLIVMILMVLFLSLNLATVVGGDEVIKLSAFALESFNLDGELMYLVTQTNQMGILALLCALLPFFMIFMYRRRMLQVRLCFVLMFMLLGLQVFVGYYLYNLNIDNSVVRYSVVDGFPIISIILIYLAFRGVIRDEMLIRGLNRIR